MLGVAWELVAACEPAWLAAHKGLPPPRYAGQDADGIRTWVASYSRRDYPAALHALVVANVAWLSWYRSHHGPVPRLYEAGVRYMRECCGEVWRVIPAVLTREGGDCEDLAAYRAAELISDGMDARVMVQEVARDASAGSISYHVLVRLPNGATEDPAAALGDGADAKCDPSGPHGRPCG